VASHLLERVLLPPTSPLLLMTIGMTLVPFHHSTALILMLTGVACMYLCSTFGVADRLMYALQPYAPLTDTAIQCCDAQAIIVLGGKPHPLTQGTDDNPVSRFSIERVRYAAELHAATGLPILASGGRPDNEYASEAELMTEAFRDRYQTEVKWLEQDSCTTWDNATMSYALLGQQKIHRVLLVTHAWHMPRADYAFKQIGFEVIPAPTAFHQQSINRFAFEHWLPNAYAIMICRLALHEYLGLYWYRLKNRA
jgi:uncharacterized SAM-binding protein YcdF (DUF218 family)